MTETLLALRTVDGKALQRSLSAFLREQASQAQASSPANPPRERLEATRNFALFVDALDSERDQRLAAIAVAQRHQGSPAGTYAPGPTAGRLIVTLGHAPLAPDLICAELVRAELEDALGHVARVQAERSSQREREIFEEANRRADERIAKADARAEQAEAGQAEVEAVNAAQARRIAHLELGRPATNGSEPPEGDEPEATYRRRSFAEDVPGVFRTRRKPDAAVTFEVKVGSNPWETFSDRDEAIAAAEAAREHDDGPTKQTSGNAGSLEEIGA
jgi:hypothetical protein